MDLEGEGGPHNNNNLYLLLYSVGILAQGVGLTLLSPNRFAAPRCAARWRGRHSAAAPKA
jgi:hypothetical protein